MPIVYLGFGGLAGSAIYMNNQYVLYRRSYLYTARVDENGDPVFPEYADDYAKLLEQLGQPPEEGREPEDIAAQRQRLEPAIRSQRDSLRRNRDLLLIGIGVWYGLTLLDAYVSAHLLDFDVGEDLSISFYPVPHGFSTQVRIDL